MTPDEITAKARDLVETGCGCDDDATNVCPNWNGERCTYAEFAIATFGRECAKEARDKALTEAAAVADKYGWSQDAGERVSSYGEGALDIADAIASMIRRLKLKDTAHG